MFDFLDPLAICSPFNGLIVSVRKLEMEQTLDGAFGLKIWTFIK